MEAVLIILAVLGWWILGTAGFIYWWTSEFDLNTDDMLQGIITGVLGPSTFVLGFFIHGRERNRVLLKRRS